MEYTELCRQYRELDRDCANLHYELSGGKDEERKLFIPDEANMEKAWNRFRELKERVASLEEPDAVFALVRHHFEDFLDSQEYALEDAGKHPEGGFLYMHWMIENTSRLSRKPDEERCQKMVSQLEEICEASDIFLGLIKSRRVRKNSGRLPPPCPAQRQLWKRVG